MIEFDFPLEEVQRIAYIGSLRRIDAMRHGRKHRHGYTGDDDWTVDIEGLGAEVAVTKALGLEWSPLIGATDRHGDVGDVHVRWTPRESGCLILHESDPDDAPFALVTGKLPRKTVVGWTLASDGKVERNWRDDVRNPAFFVPQTELRPFPDRRADAAPTHRAA